MSRGCYFNQNLKAKSTPPRYITIRHRSILSRQVVQIEDFYLNFHIHSFNGSILLDQLWKRMYHINDNMSFKIKQQKTMPETLSFRFNFNDRHIGRFNLIDL